MATTTKTAAAKIAQAHHDLDTLYARFDAARTPAERDAIAAQLVQLSFDPDATLESVSLTHA